MDTKFALLALLLFILSWLLSNSSQAQPTLPVPEFTVKFYGQPHYQPPVTTTTIDPYTGNTISITSQGYYHNNGTIIISIKNQPYDSYQGDYSVYYWIRMKGHFENWTGYILPSNLTVTDDLRGDQYGNSPSRYYLPRSGEYSVRQYPTDGSESQAAFPPNAQIDFQLMTLVFYKSTVFVATSPGPWNVMGGYNQINYSRIANSDWSETQTVTIPAVAYDLPSSSATSEPTPTSTVPEFSTAVLVFLFIVGAFLATISQRKRTSKPFQPEAANSVSNLDIAESFNEQIP